MYDRKDKEHEDLVDDTTCIANCIRTSDPPEKDKQSQLFKYKFQKQKLSTYKNSKLQNQC